MSAFSRKKRIGDDRGVGHAHPLAAGCLCRLPCPAKMRPQAWACRLFSLAKSGDTAPRPPAVRRAGRARPILTQGFANPGLMTHAMGRACRWLIAS